MGLPARRETVTFEDAAMIFKNFAGEARKFNAEGDRNFCIMLGEQQADELRRSGWNVKQLKRREEDDEQYYFLKVKVNFAVKPPRCYLISSGGKTLLGESLIGMMDHLDFTLVDLVISPYDWNVNGNEGRTAYLQSMFATMYEDELELKYASVPQITSAGDVAPKELEPGARLAYDYEGDVVDER